MPKPGRSFDPVWLRSRHAPVVLASAIAIVTTSLLIWIMIIWPQPQESAQRQTVPPSPQVEISPRLSPVEYGDAALREALAAYRTALADLLPRGQGRANEARDESLDPFGLDQVHRAAQIEVLQDKIAGIEKLLKK